MTEWTYIEWLDHHSFGDEWNDADDLDPKALLVYSVGRVLAENDDALILAPTFYCASEETKPAHVHGAINILKACIQKRELLLRSNVRARRPQNHLHPSKHNKTQNGRAAYSRNRNS